MARLTIHAEQHPCDDLEALGYMMIYLLRGQLPWQGLKAHSDGDKARLVMEKKIALNVEDLCAGLPAEFVEYMTYVKTHPHGALPDYLKLRELFHSVAEREGIEFDNVFDWTVRLYLEEDGKPDVQKRETHVV